MVRYSQNDQFRQERKDFSMSFKEIKPEETTAIQTETESESEAQPEKETDIVDAIDIPIDANPI